MQELKQLDAYARPPDSLRQLFKKYQRCRESELHADINVVDTCRANDELAQWLKPAPLSLFGDKRVVFKQFLSNASATEVHEEANPVLAFEVLNAPGCYILPNLLSAEVQKTLLGRLLHRDLANPVHRTNVNLHHEVSYPSGPSPSCISSFFGQEKSILFPPKDPAVHMPITMGQFLERKLRWMTLGGQYDWSAKRYPAGDPPTFPADVKQLLRGIFPHVEAQAAIVNFYSPGDTLSMHRDVSEMCDRGLVSISIGCDGILLVGNQDGSQAAALRLKSGDAVYMAGPARYAWHGVPKIIPDTCPKWLADWPAGGSETQYDCWQGWISRKRINVNVRQMMETS